MNLHQRFRKRKAYERKHGKLPVVIREMLRTRKNKRLFARVSKELIKRIPSWIEGMDSTKNSKFDFFGNINPYPIGITSCEYNWADFNKREWYR